MTRDVMDGDVYIGGEPYDVLDDVKMLRHVPCGTALFGDGSISEHECPPACPECGQRDEDARVEPDGDGYLIWRCCGQEARCVCGQVTSTNHRSVCTAWIQP